MTLLKPKSTDTWESFRKDFLESPEAVKAFPDELKRLSVCRSIWMAKEKPSTEPVGGRPTLGYSSLEVKQVDEESRIISGIASTPNVDRAGDILLPEGVKFSLPLPLLWQHRMDEPVGFVEKAEVTEDGISFVARFAKVADPGPLRDSIEKAWQAVKERLVRGVSVGFLINSFEILKSGGWKITDWEWFELSVVTVPANADASIENIRSIDAACVKEARNPPVAPDIKRDSGKRAGASAQVKIQETKLKKTIAEQISGFEATRQSKAARMDEIMDAAAEEGVTLSAEQKEEYDTLEVEVKEIDEHLVRLRAREKSQRDNAVPVDPPTNERDASRSRSGIRVENVRSNVPEGIPFTRFAMSLCRAKGSLPGALAVFKANKDWMNQSPEVEAVLKAAVEAGTTTDTDWAAPLVEYQVMASEFAGFLRPLTIIGRIPNLRRVPFKIKVPRQTAAASTGWVGEKKPKPVGSLAFDNVSLDFAKAAGIVAITMELARLSNPSAELLVRNDLASGIVKFLDNEFIDPDNAAVANVSPAGIPYGVTPVVASGTAYSDFSTDLKAVLANFFAANVAVGGIVVVMSQGQALAFSLMENSLGNARFPQMTAEGGNFLGFTVIASENIPYTEGSPQEGSPIIFLKPSEILLADDGGVSIDVSTEASLQMNSAPDDPVTATTVLVSLWQNNMIGIRAERAINWTKRNDNAVQYISAGKYV